MDTTKTITHLGLCAGYGGIELGLKRVLPTLRTVALCEIEAFACANLVAKMEAGLMDPAPIWTDLKTFPWAEFRDRVDILTGGYPCQPFSSAGKRLGTNDPRHLWPYIASGIRLLRPRVCFFENVEGHISLGLREVVGELEGLGYETTWGIFSAAECGAPHQRKRVFILANSNGKRGQLSDWGRFTAEQVLVGNGPKGRDVWPSRPGEPQHAWEPPRVVVADTYKHGNGTSIGREARQGFGELHNESTSVEPPRVVSGLENSTSKRGRGASGDTIHQGWATCSTGAEGVSQDAERNCGAGSDAVIGTRIAEKSRGEVESSLGGDAYGPFGGLGDAELFTACDNRTDELRLLGNGVVPATAEIAFRTLMAELNTDERNLRNSTE